MSPLLAGLLGLGMGLLTGMGLGGGKLLVPILVVLFGLEQARAQGVTLFVFLPVAAVAAWIHREQRTADLPVAWKVVGGSVAGAVAGALLATRAPPAWLRVGYGSFLLVMGLYELVSGAGERRRAG